MGDQNSSRKDYLIVAGLGAIGGGLLVAYATKAIPKMLSQLMAGMMRSMMSQMAGEGCDPGEI